MRSNGGRCICLFVVCLSKPRQLPEGSCSSSHWWLYAAASSLLQTSPGRQASTPLASHHPEEGTSSGCPYLAVHVYHIIHVCTVHMLVTPLFTHKNGRESHNRRHGSRAFDPRMGHLGPSLAIAAGIVRQIEPAREAVGSARAAVMHSAERCVLGNLDPVYQPAYIHTFMCPRIGRRHLLLQRGPPCIDNIDVYIPLGIPAPWRDSMVADIQHERATILVPVQAFATNKYDAS